ncbi:MAG: hypothetical protein QM570_18295 [Planctomycetota bacterium]|jgi:hypothetical protein|nr:hypothetical protein [Planctomycetota bacterium]
MKSLDPTPTANIEEATTTTNAPDRTFRAEKASGSLRPIAEWLAGRTSEAKLTALIVFDLLRHEYIFRREGLYAGEMGNDLLTTWKREVLDHSPSDDPREQMARGFCIGLTNLDS